MQALPLRVPPPAPFESYHAGEAAKWKKILAARKECGTCHIFPAGMPRGAQVQVGLWLHAQFAGHSLPIVILDGQGQFHELGFAIASPVRGAVKNDDQALGSGEVGELPEPAGLIWQFEGRNALTCLGS